MSPDLNPGLNSALKPEWIAYLYVALGGGLGSMARFAMSHLPLGTYWVNLIGCFVIGVLSQTNQEARWFWVVGALGGFTTFSTFGLETWNLIQSGRLGTALIYSLGSLLTGIAGVALGMAAHRSWFKLP